MTGDRPLGGGPDEEPGAAAAADQPTGPIAPEFLWEAEPVVEPPGRMFPVAPPLEAPQPPRSRKAKRRVLLLVGMAVSVALVIVVIVAVSNKPTNLSLSVPTTVPSSTPTTLSASSSTTPRATLPAGTTALAQLLPSDADAPGDCSPNTTPPSLTGLTDALICAPKQLPGGQIFAFQFDSAADYTTSLAALNKFKGFDSTTAGSTCPPANGAEDATGWHNASFPALQGQILECLSVGTNDNQPDYIWTYPMDNAVIDAQGAANYSFSDLDNWWTKDAPPA